MAVPLHGSAVGKAFRTRQFVYLNHEEQPDPEIYGTPEGQEFYQLLLREGEPSGYFLPLVRGDEVIAVMLLTKYGRKPLKAQEAEFLTALAGQLSAAVANALEHAALVAARERLASEQVYLREEVVRSSMFEEIVGSSKALREIQSQISRVAPTDSTVLIQGETGTGKELIARAIHNRSKRANRAFICINCAAISPSLIASELFGHEKGAFTGALQRRPGRLNWPTAARFSWTRWENFRPRCRLRCFGFCRKGHSNGLAAISQFALMCVYWQPPTKTCNPP